MKDIGTRVAKDKEKAHDFGAWGVNEVFESQGCEEYKTCRSLCQQNFAFKVNAVSPFSVPTALCLGKISGNEQRVRRDIMT